METPNKAEAFCLIMSILSVITVYYLWNVEGNVNTGWAAKSLAWYALMRTYERRTK